MGRVPAEVYSNFDVAWDYIQRGRNGFSRTIANNTRVEGRYSGALVPENIAHVAIEFHQTDIIELYPNGDTAFYTNGWDTVTTRERIGHNDNFSTYIYVPRGRGRGGPSTISSNIGREAAENRLRAQYGYEPKNGRWDYVSSWPHWRHFYSPLTGRCWPVITNLEEYQRAEEFEREWRELLARRWPTYVFQDGIRFTKRGRCVTEGVERLSVLRAREQRERERRTKLVRAAMSVSWKAIRRLRTGLIIPDCEGCETVGPERPEHTLDHLRRRTVSGTLVRTAVEFWLAGRNARMSDWRYWLNFHATKNCNTVIGGAGLSPRVEPHIWKAVYGYLSRAIPEV